MLYRVRYRVGSMVDGRSFEAESGWDAQTKFRVWALETLGFLPFVYAIYQVNS